MAAISIGESHNPFGILLILLLIGAVIIGFGWLLVQPVYMENMYNSQRESHILKHSEANVVRDLLNPSSSGYCGDQNVISLFRVLPDSTSRLLVCIVDGRIAVQVWRVVGERVEEITAFFLERPSQLIHLIVVRGYVVEVIGQAALQQLNYWATLSPETAKVVSKFIINLGVPVMP